MKTNAFEELAASIRQADRIRRAEARGLQSDGVPPCERARGWRNAPPVPHRIRGGTSVTARRRVHDAGPRLNAIRQAAPHPCPRHTPTPF